MLFLVTLIDMHARGLSPHVEMIMGLVKLLEYSLDIFDLVILTILQDLYFIRQLIN